MTDNNYPGICAVVVTYNRLELLKRLIQRLQSQTVPPDHILIVNNGSTDGTADWLHGQKNEYIMQDNLGSAGGFYTGIKVALEKKYGYVWLMDDDGYPEKDCLEKLVAFARTSSTDADVCCSVVVDPESPSELSFHIPDLRSKYYNLFDHYTRLTDKVSQIQSFNGAKGYPWGLFFNSVLLPRQAIKKAGLPKKELFIWGDEVEYFYRLKKNKISIMMIPESVFYHPKTRDKNIARWKEKYATRNYVYINRLYKPLPFIHHLYKIFKIIWHRKFYLLSPFFHGLTQDFTKRYIP